MLSRSTMTSWLAPLIFVVGMLTMLACSSASDLRALLATPTGTPTITRTPTPTRPPTETPEPTATYTLVPTLPPLPTATALPQACATAVPRSANLHVYGSDESIALINVLVVHFVPRDALLDPQWREKMDSTLNRVKEFHEVQLGCQSALIYTTTLQPITGTLKLSDYQQLDAGRAWNSVQLEVLARVSPPQIGYPIIIVQAQFETKDKRSFGGTNRWGGFALMDGQVLSMSADLAGGYYYHELGHAFGLPHAPQDPKSVMGGAAKELSKTFISVFQVAKLRGSVDWKAIVQEMDAALKADAADESLYQIRGDAYENQKNYAAAQKDYDQWIKLRPSAYAYQARGNLWLAQLDYTRALSDYVKAIELEPNFVTPYTGAGLASFYAKNYDPARVYFEKALTLDGNNPLALGGLAHTWRALQRCDRAAPYYRRAIALEPTNQEWRRGLQTCGG